MHGGATAAVIKADAYGLGAAGWRRSSCAAGCENFFVAHLAEALAVRTLIPRALLGVLNGLRLAEAGRFRPATIVPVLGSLDELASGGRRRSGWDAFCRRFCISILVWRGWGFRG